MLSKYFSRIFLRVCNFELIHYQCYIASDNKKRSGHDCRSFASVHGPVKLPFSFTAKSLCASREAYLPATSRSALLLAGVAM